MKTKQSSVIAIVIISALILSASFATAATITVDTTADIINSGNSDGACSLREAVISANNDVSMDTCTAGSGDDTIVLSAGEYMLTVVDEGYDYDSLTGDLNISSSVTIDGGGQAIINGNASYTIFAIINTPSDPMRIVTLNNIALTGGDAGMGDEQGGAIYALRTTVNINNSVIKDSYAELNGGGLALQTSTANITNSSITGNSTRGGATGGGGIYLSGSTANIINSTLSDNNSDFDGGGIYMEYSSKVNILKTLISNNTASVNGGGILAQGGSVNITESTISDNSSTWWGGGLDLSFSPTIIINSAIDGNSSNRASGIMTADGSINIINSTISRNTGGGVYVSASPLSISGSTINDNTGAEDGGGIYIVSISGDNNITNSTISGNSATDEGGGMYVYGLAAINITNSTLTENSAGTIGGGLIVNTNSTVTIGGTIISGNTASTSGDECSLDSATITSNGYNIVNDVSSGGCTFSSTGDQTSVDPLLGSLANNGGLTKTHALLEGSPAIGAGNPACAGGTDQRGASRPVDGDASGTATCDIGAYEYLSTPPAIDEPAAAVSESSMSFATLNPSGYSDSTITLTNDGTGDLVIGTVGDTDPLEAPFSIVGDECSDQSLASGETCDITVRFEPSIIAAAATGLGSLGIVMHGVVLGAGITRKRKTLALLLIGAVIAVSMLTACGSSSSNATTDFTGSFNIPSNDPDTPNITVNVNGSY